ncbi:MAG: hypothetical protein N3F66_06090 [Spirochaetes bacterium]|nr:hypothetical protein [Spirochaetota bacterium]
MRKIFIISLALYISMISCATKKGIVARKSTVTPGSRIVVIANHPNNIKNVIIARFMNKNYSVKAFNASDLYTIEDVYDIKDFKKVAYMQPLKNDNMVSFEKAVENIYKLHIYNYELSKAEALSDLRTKYGTQYLILMELKDWQKVSWARAIDLTNMEVIWVENYPAQYKDTLETVVDHFISSMSGQ